MVDMKQGEIEVYSLDVDTDEMFGVISNPVTERELSKLLDHVDVRTGVHGVNQDPAGTVNHFLYDTPAHRDAAYSRLSKYLKSVRINHKRCFIPGGKDVAK